MIFLEKISFSIVKVLIQFNLDHGWEVTEMETQTLQHQSQKKQFSSQGGKQRNLYDKELTKLIQRLSIERMFKKNFKIYWKNF